ncbi:uncharacterized protein STEHIDRAFT_149632 [Stereum hirsutum FP-91666 SS1]|uniref:uncharacterized protein n=1 Tax=Stereum hirsutum (strain FP-91666) TaxID=721885 RepID=UPI000444A5BC|nr:uncharacterized protein STEHIDRAFT_149632 [Stereum hirsutum FP-91666 SS1]EIM81867.1 hypothetical protein STEHIDRAFT_149632 [Stereum hirsutum FP-91666 SS1]
MAMDHFSWSDTFHALLSPCLSCLRAAHPHPHLSSNDHLYHSSATPIPIRSDQASASLEGLLASDASSEEAETLSLHSNFGAGRIRRKKKRAGNWVRIWGWDLFGRRGGAIQLPPDDVEAADEDGGGEGDEERRERRERRRKATLSSSTLDSDAAPVDVGAITSQLAAQPEPSLSLEDEAREKAERKARRKERKELKRAALAYSLEHGADEEFEGFQGSGSAPRIPSPFTRGAHRHQDSMSSHTSSSGNMRSPPLRSRMQQGGDGEEEDDEEELADADFDARAYAKRRSSNGGSGGTGSGSRSSDSRSRTSASASQSGPNHTHPAFPPSPLGQPDHDPSATSTPNSKPKRTKSKSKSSKSSSSTGKKSSNDSNNSDPTDQSPSLISPTTSQFLDATSKGSGGGGEQLIEVRREDFLDLNLPSPGFNLNLRLPTIDGQVNSSGLGSGLGNGNANGNGQGGLGLATSLSPSNGNGGFPSPGLGGPRNGGAGFGGGGMNGHGVGKRDVGAFLAKSGWDA